MSAKAVLFTEALAFALSLTSAEHPHPIPQGPSQATITPAVQRIIDDMNTTVDPCTDFSAFTCGGYRARETIPAGHSSKFDSRNITGLLIDSLRSAANPSGSMALGKAKALYRSCMKEDTIASQGTTQLLNYIQQIGGWPVLGTWTPLGFKLEDILAKSRPYMGPGNNALIGVTVVQDIGQTGRFTLLLDQPKLGQSPVYGHYVNPDMYLIPRDSVYTMAYQKHITDVAVYLGAAPYVAKQAAREIVDFEIELAKIMLPVEEKRKADLRYQKTAIYELYRKYPRFDWLWYLRHLTAPAGVTLSFGDSLVLWDSAYYDKLFTLLRSTSIRVTANYLAWRAIQPLLSTQGRQFQLSRLRFDATSNGAPGMTLPSRDAYCAGIVDGHMTGVTGKMYMDSNPIGAQKQQTIGEIWDYVRNALIDAVQTAKWLSEQSKMATIQKIRATSAEFGYPSYLNEEFLNKYYEKFQMTVNFFGNVKDCQKQNYIQSFKQLKDPSVGRWVLSVTLARTYFSRSRNAFEMPALLLEEPWYSDDYSPSLNFGGFGTVMGRLYGHTLDLEGLSYNTAGLLQKTWSETSTANLLQKAQCIIDKFTKPNMPDQMQTAKKGVDENMADLIGFKIGYKAYKKWSAERGYVDTIPGLPYTEDQLYFINSAQWLCDKMSPEVAVKAELEDVFNNFQRRLELHSLPELPILRVIIYPITFCETLVAIMQNLPEFAHAFQCPVGSPMNPAAKCHIFLSPTGAHTSVYGAG